ncbi:MAG: phage holin family protein [Myxococcales bacterium]|nr:phage holin family protein [Myxococcales bacterium]
MLTQLLLGWLIVAVAVLITGAVLPGVQVRGFGGALITSALLGLLHVLIGWVLFVLLGLATLGLGFLLAFITKLFVTAILLRIVAAITDSFHVRSWGSAFLAALLISVLGSVGELVLRLLTT